MLSDKASKTWVAGRHNRDGGCTMTQKQKPTVPGGVEMRSTAFAQTRKSCLGRSAIAVARRGGGHEGLCWDFYTQKAKVDTESVKTP